MLWYIIMGVVVVVVRDMGIVIVTVMRDMGINIQLPMKMILKLIIKSTLIHKMA